REEPEAGGDDNRPLGGFEERYRTDSGTLCRPRVHRLEPGQRDEDNGPGRECAADRGGDMNPGYRFEPRNRGPQPLLGFASERSPFPSPGAATLSHPLPGGALEGES